MPARQHFTEELNRMHQDILRMGSLVESALKKALAALSEKNADLAQSVIEEDKRIDELQVYIEETCAKLLATEQPVASDLREILTAIKITADLERIGDHARHLAKSVENISNSPYFEAVPRLKEMAEFGIRMVHDALTAFVERDAEKATEIARRDDQLDNMKNQMLDWVLEIMESHPKSLRTGIDFLFLNRFLERLGDHVTNMCEWIVYSRRGEHIELNT